MDDNRTENTRKPRPGSARYRQQRRKQQQRQQSQVRRPTADSQVRSGERLTMPEIPIPRGVLRVVGTIVVTVGLVVGIIYTLRLFNPPEAVTLPNAIWMGTGWSYDDPTDEAVIGLASRLRQHRIGTAYVWVSYLRDDLTWSGKTADRNLLTGEITNTVNPATGDPYRNELAEMEPNIMRFVQQYKTAYPEGRLYGWISYPTNLDADGYTLDDPTLHTRIAELAAVLVTSYGFDGIYLNVEPVRDGDENFLDMLRTVRRTLDTVSVDGAPNQRIPIAVAIPPDWRPSDPTIPFGTGFTDVFEWSPTYKQSVALLTDELLVMAYHSGLTDPADYSQWVAYQTRAYAEAVAALAVDTEVLIGIPTYPAELPAHDPEVENVQTAVEGIYSGLIQAGDAAEVVTGVTIYAEWTTDGQEWSDFQTYWVDPPASLRQSGLVRYGTTD